MSLAKTLSQIISLGIIKNLRIGELYLYRKTRKTRNIS